MMVLAAEEVREQQRAILLLDERMKKIFVV